MIPKEGKRKGGCWVILLCYCPLEVPPFLAHASLQVVPSILDLCVCTKYKCHILGKRVDLMQEKVSHCLFHYHYSPIRGQGDETSSHAMGMLSLSVMAVFT